MTHIHVHVHKSIGKNLVMFKVVIQTAIKIVHLPFLLGTINFSIKVNHLWQYVYHAFQTIDWDLLTRICIY